MPLLLYFRSNNLLASIKKGRYMFGHLTSRTSVLHHSIAVALLYSASLMALPTSGYAVSFGQTMITSAQHEPLEASISITDFKPRDFSVALANMDVYQQLGLTYPASLSVRFAPASPTSGHVIIRTSEPITAPFADLVLNINEQGQRTMVPKTLLLPLSSNVELNALKSESNRYRTSSKDANLQSIDSSNTQVLTVTRGAPPPLFIISDIQNSKPLQVKILKTEASLPVLTGSTGSLTQEFNVLNNIEHNNSTDQPVLNTKNIQVPEKLFSNPIKDKPIDTLNIQVTRYIQVTNKKVIEKDTSQPAILVDTTTESSKPYELEARLIKPYTQ